MSGTLDMSTLNLDELNKLLSEARAQAKLVRDAEVTALHAAIGESGTEFATAIVDNTRLQESEKSGWQGHAASGIPVVVNGREGTLSATVTFVKGSRSKQDGE